MHKISANTFSAAASSGDPASESTVLTSKTAPGFKWKWPEAKTGDSGTLLQQHVLPHFELMFLGTGGSNPSRFKNPSCAMLNLGRQKNFLFDAGEGALRQATRTPMFSMTDVSNIFITHTHADHILGLPSVILTACVRPTEIDVKPLRIYGPKGLYDYLSAVLSLTRSSLRRKVIVCTT